MPGSKKNAVPVETQFHTADLNKSKQLPTNLFSTQHPESSTPRSNHIPIKVFKSVFQGLRRWREKKISTENLCLNKYGKEEDRNANLMPILAISLNKLINFTSEMRLLIPNWMVC